ncbi:MAG: SH3 domain-containing protein [Hyphomicrobiales bacterium]|nr:MAG: SH3 domain-containing protein [Hyphomicrobiales bacterium]
MRQFLTLAAALALGALSPCAQAQDASQVLRVSFKDGRAVVRGAVKGYDTHDYVFPAGAGESIKIRLTSRKAFFNVNPPGSEEALFNGSIAGSIFTGEAAISGDYTARVYLMRNEARRGAVSPYTLAIEVGQKKAAAEKGPDFADGLTGGPDYWQVTGVPAGDALKIRATSSPKARLVADAPNGAALRNLGCRNTGGQRWCRVEDARKQAGWVNGRYLREGPGPDGQAR